jgi:hypothetical protein
MSMVFIEYFIKFLHWFHKVLIKVKVVGCAIASQF